MTDLITEARELCEGATSGKWKRHDTADYAEIHNGDTWGKNLNPIALVGHTDDANFIARSRTLIPELCDALEKAQEQNKQLLHEVCKLACESVERDRALARLEVEVMAACNSARWIPVTERLPEQNIPVLVTYVGYIDNKPYSDGVAKRLLELNGYNGGWPWTLDEGEVAVEVTHWMPLPAPPEEGE